MLVAVCCTILLVSKSKLYQFFARSSTLTAITVYILIVGIIYNLLLRAITHASGISEVDNEIFHVAVPILFFLYWFMYVSKAHLSWQYAFAWLIYPVVYVIYTLLHGFVTNFYPYPFINAYKLGYAKTLINGAFLLVAFFAFSILLISVKSIHKKSIID